MRKTLAAKKKFGQLIEAPLELPRGSVARENALSAAANLDLDFPRARRGFGSAEMYPRPQRTGTVVDFCLGQIQKIFTFNIARTHVVADGVPDNLAARIDDQRQFRLRHIPTRIAPDTDRFTGRNNFLGDGLEEKFRSFRGVNPVISRRAEIRF